MISNTQKAVLALILGLLSMPVFAQSVTHFGQPFQRHVTLVLRFDGATSCNNGRAFFKRFPAGDTASDEFRVPGGDIFVVTGFSWQTIPSPASFASNAILEATLLSRFGTQSFRLAHTSAAINLTPDFASMNRIAGSSDIKSGIQIGTGRILCATAQSRTVSFTAFHTVASAEVTGYLVKK